jgi:peroxiredoxin
MKSAQFSNIRSARPLFWMAMMAMAVAFTGCTGGASSDTLVVQGDISNFTGDSIRIYEVMGVRINPIAAAKVDVKDNKATFNLSHKLGHTGFYLIGDDPRRSMNVVLGGGGEVQLTGDWTNPQGCKLAGGVLNDQYAALQQRVSNHNQQLQGLYQNLQLFAQSDPMQVTRIQGDISNLNNSHFKWLDSLEAKKDFMGKVASIYNFKPFMSDPSHSKYGNELTYFKDAFFANLDFKDAEMANMPQLYDKARAYASTLVGASVPRDVSKVAMDGLLTQAGAGSSPHESILRGYVAGLEQTKSDLFVDYGKAFVATYPKDQQYVASINAVIASMESMASGSMAPDFSAATPEGGTLKLSDFRGKYVMIDFWASWCRPCRMENPNVVKAYNKYHGKGFEILGVSLDQEKGKWDAAIKQDGLLWKHVSDLQGWQSAPAQLYGVNSIPATVLVDTEGKIIARNLRGQELEAKLKEIFGS